MPAKLSEEISLNQAISMAENFMKPIYSLVLVFPLGGCYTVNQTRFDAHIAETINATMTMQAAIQKLAADGFSCSKVSSVDPAVSCTKTRQSLLPTTCIERVNVEPAADQERVGAIEARPIVCAGL